MRATNYLRCQLVLAAVILTMSSPAFGQMNYFVSTTGNNGNSGTAIDQAWQTIQYACDHASAGDIINVLAGTYYESINITTSGSPGNLLTLQNYNSDEVIVSGSNLPAYGYLLKIENQSYLRIYGIKFSDYQALDAIGLYLVNSSYIEIVKNEFSNIDYSPTALGQTPSEDQNSQPIIVFGRDAATPLQGLLISGNSIHDCETGWSEGLSINGNIDGFEVVENHVYNNTNIGIVAIGHEGECPTAALDQARNGRIYHNIVHDNTPAYAAAAGIYIDGASQITVENNVLYNNAYGIEIGCENNGQAPNDPSADNILVRNNVIYNNTLTGIALGGYDYPTSGKVEYVSIRNNTCFNNDTENNYQGEMMISYAENSNIENNIFYTNNTDHVLFTVENGTSTCTLDYNLFFTPSGSENIVIYWDGPEYTTFAAYQTATGQSAHALFLDPQFIDIGSNPDLHLQAGSPARNAGNPGFQITDGLDMDNEARINESLVDIGSDEYYTTTGTISKIAREILLYPNPVQGWLHYDFPNQTVRSISVYDITGRVIIGNRGTDLKNSIDVSTLAKGVYLIGFQIDGELQTAKIIKQ